MQEWIIVGLGNPGDAYEKTRHNVGRRAVFLFAGEDAAQVFARDATCNATTAILDTQGDNQITLVLPDTFMNHSGASVAPFFRGAQKETNLIVVYDDLDISFGRIKISFGRNSGGHKGVSSIISTLGTKDFIRVRIGVAPTTPTGEKKVLHGEKKVNDFLLGNFTTREEKKLPELLTQVHAILNCIIHKGYTHAMQKYNTRT